MKISDKSALNGIRVLELGSLAAGPFCGRLLADFGADVIKVEQMEGDTIRLFGTRYRGKSLHAASMMRNKKLIAIDLKRKEGQDLIKKMVNKVDVVIENFRPKTLEKWGLGYADLKKLKPDIIMTRISGFGQYGPYSQRPGYGVIGEAMCGLRHMTGDPDRPPARVAIPLTDFITGVYAAFGTLLALIHRRETGEGQYIDLALYEAAFSFMHLLVPEYEKLKIIPCRVGSRLPNMTPNNLYKCKNGEYIHIGAGNQSIFKRLVTIMGKENLLENPKFSTPVARSENEDEMDEIIGKWVSQYDADELDRKLMSSDVPASKIYNMADIFNDLHFKERDMLVTIDDDELGSITLSGIIPKLSNSPGKIKWGGGRLGENTIEILKELAHLSDEEINQLEKAGAILVYRREQK